MSVGPPICRVCEVPHWARDPHVWKGEKAAAPESVTKPRVTRNKPAVTRNFDARDEHVRQLAERDAEIAELRARIAELEERVPKLKPNSRAEYMRAYRAKK